jgi:hypothetical protein
VEVHDGGLTLSEGRSFNTAGSNPAVRRSAATLDGQQVRAGAATRLHIPSYEVPRSLPRNTMNVKHSTSTAAMAAIATARPW